MEIPGELRSLLGILGYNWPEADETALVEMGRAWMSFSGRLEAIVSGRDVDRHRGVDRARGRGRRR